MLTSTTRQSRILGMKALLKTCELGCKVPLNQRLIHIIFAARRDIKALEDIIAEIGRITTGVSTVMGT